MDPQRSTPRLRTVQPDPACPMCGNTGITTSWNCHAFEYGSAESAVELTVSVPVRRCESCEFEYVDEAAERLKHEAVCQHLGVLPPTEIRRIRKDLRMTRARFAQVTGIGKASLNRWENGLNIQTHANDRYLRLLARPGMMRQLQELVAIETPSQPVVAPVGNRFRTLEVTDALLKEQESFRLRTVA